MRTYRQLIQMICRIINSVSKTLIKRRLWIKSKEVLLRGLNNKGEGNLSFFVYDSDFMFHSLGFNLTYFPCSIFLISPFLTILDNI